MEAAIGGYFELELPPPYGNPYPDALCFQSARACFLALLLTGRPRRVWMPGYICDSMLAPLYAAGIECIFYSIDDSFGIAGQVTLEEEDWLLYVNYFGVCGRNVGRVLTMCNRQQVIIDNSQAFFSSPQDCLATIFSPRKFFGVPDGGLLVTDLPVPEPTDVDQESLSRSIHLLKRIDDSPEAGYEDYRHAEESLNDLRPRRMSRLTERLLSGIDYQRVRCRRNENFLFLHERLGHLNDLDIDLSIIDGPLCYPLYADIPKIREQLIAHRIFVPTYWPDVIGRVDEDTSEAELVHKCVAIPCDHRCQETELTRVVEIIRSRGEREK